MEDGWLWNTMVIVARAKVLMELVRKQLPDLAARFTLLKRFLGSVRERDLIEQVYRAIPKINFSVSVLAAQNTQSFVFPVQNVWWSDWGTKERVLDTAAALGLVPSSPIRIAHDPLSIPL